MNPLNQSNCKMKSNVYQKKKKFATDLGFCLKLLVVYQIFIICRCTAAAAVALTNANLFIVFFLYRIFLYEIRQQTV